jgi:hypothetical protein
MPFAFVESRCEILRSEVGSCEVEVRRVAKRARLIAVLAAALALMAVLTAQPAGASRKNPKARSNALSAHIAAQASGSSPTVLDTCDDSSLRSAIATATSTGDGTVQFACSGDISLTSSIVVSGSEDVTLDASQISGGATLVWGDYSTPFQAFRVQGGTLNLLDVNVSGFEDQALYGTDGTLGADGTAGTDGVDGASGLDGAPGQPGTPGTSGSKGASGTDGTNGADATQGGAMYIGAGSTVNIIGGSFDGDYVSGGGGGNAGPGGTGGEGGNGGIGGGGGQGTPSPMCYVAGGDGGDGASGGSGGSGGAGGDAGTAGNGGSAQGGAIYNNGTLTVTDASFQYDGATGGPGGVGGVAGQGSNGGTGGGGNTGGAGGVEAGCGSNGIQGEITGNGGNGADGAVGGDGGAGGAGSSGGNGGGGEGGAIYNTGTLTLDYNDAATNAQGWFENDYAAGGAGGYAGTTEDGGTGGAGGGGGPLGSAGIDSGCLYCNGGTSGGGGNGASGGAPGANGSGTVSGGNGGNGEGGAIYNSGTLETNLTECGDVIFAQNQATGGNGQEGFAGFNGVVGSIGGSGGNGGTTGPGPGSGADGGTGGAGGDGSSGGAGGSGLGGAVQGGSSDLSGVSAGNTATGGNGGAGSQGGAGGAGGNGGLGGQVGGVDGKPGAAGSAGGNGAAGANGASSGSDSSAVALQSKLTSDAVTAATTASTTCSYKIILYTMSPNTVPGYYWHSFVQLKSPEGDNKTVGLYPALPIGGLGAILNDGDKIWDYRIAFTVSPENYFLAKQYVQQQEKIFPYLKYNWVSNNCTNFAIDVAHAAKITLPPFYDFDPPVVGRAGAILQIQDAIVEESLLAAANGGQPIPWPGGVSAYGGTVLSNPYDTTASGAPDPPPSPDVSPLGLAQQVLSEPSTAATQFGMTFDQSALVNSNVPLGGTLKLNVESSNPSPTMDVVNWGDSSQPGYYAQEPKTAHNFSITHTYSQAGPFSVELFVIENGAIHEYTESVTAGAGKKSPSVAATVPAPPSISYVLPTGDPPPDMFTSTATTVASSASTVGKGQAVTFTVNVIPSTTQYGTPTGSITLMEGKKMVGTASLVESTDDEATTTVTVTSLRKGSVSIEATYGGDVEYSPSTSTPVVVNVQ